MKRGLMWVFVVLVLLGGGLFFLRDDRPPEIGWLSGSRVGEKSTASLEVRDEGSGIARIQVEVIQEGKGERVLLVREFPGSWWPWGGREKQQHLEIPLASVLEVLTLGEGPFLLRVTAVDRGAGGFWGREISETRRFDFDRTPPRIEVLSSQHYLRQGGSEAVLYRTSPDTVASGVRVGEKVFQGYPVPGGEGATHLALFALAHDEPLESPVMVWARDEAGNESRQGFWLKTFPGRFRSRQLDISDAFITQIAPEILSHSSDIAGKETPLETFLAINGPLREKNHRFLEDLTSHSVARLLWTQPFLQLSNSQVESSFADHRTYRYQGKKVDEQVHLGFDLASRAHSPVEASNDGVVVFAGYLGIYGNCVVVDHGLGLFSLYGHLSRVDVEKGDQVQRGQALGSTGQTGLAGGDHLHYSMWLQGVQVNPLEWWDSQWVSLHVLSKWNPS